MRPGIQRPQFKGDPPNAAPPPFSPTDISDLAVWCDASDASTVTVDGSNNVSEWRDKSGNGRDATQSSVTLRPAYASAAQNGLNAILFDSVDDVMTGYVNTVTPATWFIAHRYSGGTKESRLASNQAVNGVGFGISSASSWNLSFVREGVAWVPSGFSQGTGNRIYRLSFTVSASTYWTYSGGSETQRQTTALTGSIGSPPAFSLPGHMFEMILYHKTLSAGEISSVEAYLASKWGIA